MKKWKRILLPVLAVLVAFSFLCISNETAMAASKAPTLEDTTIWVGDTAPRISITNFDEGKDQVIKITSSNKNVLAVRKDGFCYGFTLIPKKVGTVTLTVKCKVGGKNYTLKHKYKVKKYPNVVSSLKINGKTYKVTSKKNAYFVKLNKYSPNSVKVKITPKKGWKCVFARIDMGGINNTYSGKNLKPAVITKGSKTSFPKKYNVAHIVAVFMNTTTNETFTYFVELHRQDASDGLTLAEF